MKMNVLFLVVAFSFTSAQSPINGTCPDFVQCRGPMKMSKEKISEIWYLQAIIPLFYQSTQKCTTFNFTAPADSNLVTINKTEINNE